MKGIFVIFVLISNFVFGEIPPQKLEKFNQFQRSILKILNETEIGTSLYSKPFLSKTELKEYQNQVDSLIVFCDTIYQLDPNFETFYYVSIIDFKGLLYANKYFIFKLHGLKIEKRKNVFLDLRNQVTRFSLLEASDKATIITDNLIDFWAFWYINETEKVNSKIKILCPKLMLEESNKNYFKKKMDFESTLTVCQLKKLEQKIFEYEKIYNYEIPIKFDSFINDLHEDSNKIQKLTTLEINYLNSYINALIYIKPKVNLEDLIYLDIVNQSKGEVFFTQKPIYLKYYCKSSIYMYELNQNDDFIEHNKIQNNNLTRAFLSNFKLPYQTSSNWELDISSKINDFFIKYLCFDFTNKILFENYISMYSEVFQAALFKQSNYPTEFFKVLFYNERIDLVLAQVNKINLNYGNRIPEILNATPAIYLDTIKATFKKNNIDLSNVVYVYEQNNMYGLAKGNEHITEPIYTQIYYEDYKNNNFVLQKHNKKGIALNDGKIILDAVFDSIELNYKHNIYFAKSNNLTTLFTNKGYPIVSEDSVKLTIFDKTNEFAFITKKDNKETFYYVFDKKLYKLGDDYNSIKIATNPFRIIVENLSITKFSCEYIKPLNNVFYNNPFDGFCDLLKFDFNNDTVFITPNLDAIFEYPSDVANHQKGIYELFKTIEKKINYPLELKEQKIEGVVLVKFVVQKDGCITDVKILKSVHPLFDEEAIRVINTLPPFNPAKFNKEIVKSYYTFPVSFKIKK